MTETLAWALERIRQTPISMEPYPHLVVDSFLPWEFWQRLSRDWPAQGACHDSAPNVKQWDLIADPGVKRCADGRWRRGGSYYSSRWDDFRRVFMAHSRPTPPPLVSTFCSKFSEHMESAGANVDRDMFYTVGRCAYDYEGAGLGPHTDRKDKVFSQVLYMASGEESEAERKAMGTQLLRPKPHLKDTDDRHYTWEDFDVVKTVEYIPNRLICWPVVPNSFHAYEQTVPGPRRSVKLFVQKVMPLEDVWGRIADTKEHAEDWRK